MRLHSDVDVLVEFQSSRWWELYIADNHWIVGHASKVAIHDPIEWHLHSDLDAVLGTERYSVRVLQRAPGGTMSKQITGP